MPITRGGLKLIANNFDITGTLAAATETYHQHIAVLGLCDRGGMHEIRKIVADQLALKLWQGVTGTCCQVDAKWSVGVLR